MDHPYYSVRVQSLTRGWELSCVEGTADPALSVQLIDPLTYAWAFTDEQLPGQLDVLTAQVNMASTSASAMPLCQLGDVVQLRVRLGAAGTVIVEQSLRISAAQLTIVDHKTHPARLQLTLTDTSVDWRGRIPVINALTLQRWAGRITEVGALVGLPIGVPTGWGTPENPAGNPAFSTNPLLERDQYDKVEDALTRLLQSHMPGGDPHTFAPVYFQTWPVGYDYVGNHAGAMPGGTPAQPVSSSRAVVVPASRRTSSAALPMHFTTDGGWLVIASDVVSGGAMTQAGIPARACTLPATAKRTRDSANNQVQLEGQAIFEKNSATPATLSQSYNPYTYVATDTADVAQTGARPRKLETELTYALFRDDGVPYVTQQAVYDLVVAAFMSDDTAQAVGWAYDDFTVHASLLSQAEAAAVAPVMAPRLPGETDGDGRLVRHVTIHSQAPAYRLQDAPTAGFVISGEMAIAGGELTWTITTAPGQPIRSGAAATPVTVGELYAASYSTVPTTNVSPTIIVGDLDLIDY